MDWIRCDSSPLSFGSQRVCEVFAPIAGCFVSTSRLHRLGQNVWPEHRSGHLFIGQYHSTMTHNVYFSHLKGDIFWNGSERDWNSCAHQRKRTARSEGFFRISPDPNFFEIQKTRTFANDRRDRVAATRTNTQRIQNTFFSKSLSKVTVYFTALLRQRDGLLRCGARRGRRTKFSLSSLSEEL